MLWTPLLAFIHVVLSGFSAALPPFSMTLGPGCGPVALGSSNACTGDDHSAVATAFQMCMRLNHFIPMDLCIMPIIGIVLILWVGTNLTKFVKFLLSLIPTISAGG